MEIWTAHMINFFSELCQDENRTFRSIMKTMNEKFGTHLSRNACIGKARRMNMPPRAIINNPVKGVTLHHLPGNCCKWPLGKTDDRPPYLYCGEPVGEEGGSWCAVHRKRVFSKSSDNAKIYLPA